MRFDLVIPVVLSLLLTVVAQPAPPAGFVVDSIGGSFDCVVGAQPLPDGRVLAWERTGKLWMINGNGQRVPQAVLDISDEVQGGGDCGLLGLAVHPAFPATPHVYLLYVVDRHHLLYAGTPNYNPKANLYFKATIGRLVRYTLDPATGFTSTVAGSRKVLIGANASDGIPVLYSSHTRSDLSCSGPMARCWPQPETMPVTASSIPEAQH